LSLLHALTYSIISHLDSQVPELTEVVWMYDGVSLTDRVKPFATIEQMPSSSAVIAAGRQDFEETYRFQIGLFANNISERSKLAEKVKSALKQSNISLLDTSQPFPPPTVGSFVCDVLAVTPIPVEDTADNTNKHRVYFDVEVMVYRGVADDLNFTQ
jgi:hypothetical protein